MKIAYAAYTESCVFMLDDDGICRWVVTRGAKATPTTNENAQRCIGAQYVASLDLATDGGLVATPKVGSHMLFAFVGHDGRIALVRSGSIVKFEDRRAHLRPIESAPTLRYELDPLAVTRSATTGDELDETEDAAGPRPDHLDASLHVRIEGADPYEDQDHTSPFHARPQRISGVRARKDDDTRDAIASPFSATRTTMQPEEGAIPAPASSQSRSFRDVDRCVTGRYLPIQARALQHLARLKK